MPRKIIAIFCLLCLLGAVLFCVRNALEPKKIVTPKTAAEGIAATATPLPPIEGAHEITLEDGVLIPGEIGIHNIQMEGRQTAVLFDPNTVILLDGERVDWWTFCRRVDPKSVGGKDKKLKFRAQLAPLETEKALQRVGTTRENLRMNPPEFYLVRAELP